MSARLALAAAAGISGSAAGQFITTPGITGSLSLTWQEDPAFDSNGNGVLEPGERALILLHASFSGLNTMVSFSPVVGQYSTGVIRGMTAAFVDIRSASADPAGLYNNGITTPASTSTGPNADPGGTSGYGVRGGWRIAGNASNGRPAANGFVHIQAGQFVIDPGLISPMNPIDNLDRLGWAPASYSPRTVTFGVHANIEAGMEVMALGMDAGGGGTNVVVAYIPFSSINFGSVTIPIAPAPGGLLVLAGGLIVGRRRPARG